MFKNILIAVDINDKNSWQRPLPKILELMKQFPSINLHLVSIVPNYGISLVEEYFPKGWLKELTSKTENSLKEIVKENFPADVPVNIIVGRGVIYQAIIDAATKIDADLIIMVASHPDRKDYLLGPNAAKVVRHSEISVLVIRN